MGAALLAVGVFACGSADAKYVKNPALGVYLKVPHEWTLYTLETAGPAISSVNGGKALKWAVGFDGALQPSRFHLDAPVSDTPIGVVEVYPALALNLPARNLTTLKALLSHQTYDDTAQTYSAVPLDTKISEVSEVEYGSGYFGIRLKASTTETNGKVSTLAKLALFDQSTQLLYVLAAGCLDSCYEAHRAQIEGVLDSLTMRSIE